MSYSTFSPRSAKIKEVYIELKSYQFFHSPYSHDLANDWIIGRNAVEKRIINILDSSQTKSGTYLVTGFRGMGKTSVVRKAIDRYNKTIQPFSDQVSSKVDFWQNWQKFFWFLAIYIPVTFCSLLQTSVFNEICFFGNWLFSEWSLLLNAADTSLRWTAAFLLLLLLNYLLLVLAFIIYDGIRFALKNPTLAFKSFEINLSQDELVELDVLKRIAIGVNAFWEEEVCTQLILQRPILRPWNWFVKLVSRSYRHQSSALTINRDLKRLIDRINGQLTDRREARQQMSFSFPLRNITTHLGQTKNQSLAYPQAGAKEIEDELIHIFQQIDSIRNGQLNIPKFIFVVDELDKIEPHSTSNLQERESSDPSFDTYINAPGDSRVRQRQESVARLLSNLKGFLNVVRVKFFFIGGREIFDASLADIADRDSFYSSIFDDIIYVNSFFKDKVKKRAGITQMTEHYLCKVIMHGMAVEAGEGRAVEPYSLPYLAQHIHPGEGDLLVLCPEQRADDWADTTNDSVETKLRIYKVLHLLQAYIIYLTYRSNGTPKKLSALIERHIVRGHHFLSDTKKIGDSGQDRAHLFLLHQDSGQVPEVYDKSDSLFLRFKYDLQYEIGLTANLYRPYLIAHSRYIKMLGDKLLFSSGFILDHILKFHAFGFSWRNLELIPEIILVNKEPNLRKFIEELMRFLSNTFIREAVGGIFQYRFYSKVSRELTYLSKVSDLSAAAFNFTLDESLQIKRHYKRKYLELQKKYLQSNPVTAEDNYFVHTLCFIQTILGDLYFYDKEYDEATVYYGESLQTLRIPNGDKPRLTKHQLYIYLRNSLRLGLTLEKMRAFDSAISVYRSLILELPDYLQKLIPDNRINKGLPANTDGHRMMQLITMPFIAYLGVLEKRRVDGITTANLVEQEGRLAGLLGEPGEDFKDDNIIYKLGDYTRPIHLDRYRRMMLWSDYYNNVGSVLYYKNCNYPRLFDTKRHVKSSLLPTRMIDLLGEQYQAFAKKPETFDYQPSLAAVMYYLTAINQLLSFHKKRLFDELEEAGKYAQKDISLELNQKQHILAYLPGYLVPGGNDFINAKRYTYVGNLLSKLGDAILASLGPFAGKEEVLKKNHHLFRLVRDLKIADDTRQKRAYSYLFGIVSFFAKAEQPKDHRSFFNLDTVLFLYELSAALYLRGGRPNGYAFQYKKVLYVFKDLLSIGKNTVSSDGKNVVDHVNEKVEVDRLGPPQENQANPFKKLEYIAEYLFQTVSWNFHVANRPQILKYRALMHSHKEQADSVYFYSNLNMSSDIREVIVLVEELKIRINKIQGKPSTTNDYFISAYSNVSSRFLRVQELVYKSNTLYKGMLDEEFLSYLLRLPDKQKRKEYLNSLYREYWVDMWSGKLEFFLRESLFCLREVIKSVKLFDPGYVIGLSYLAEAHRKMATWCELYQIYRELHDYKKDLPGLRNLVGNHSLDYFEANYHCEEAIQYYYEAIQMHTEGRAYKARSLNLYTLEDDFNDNLTHFGIASERWRVNTGLIRRRIEELKDRIRDTHLYKYSSHFPVGGKEDESLQ